MKFQPDSFPNSNAIARFDGQQLAVLAQGQPRLFAESVLVPWQGEVQIWPAHTPEDLSASHFEAIAALMPELVIFGSGARLQFVKPALYRSLIEARIGIETMDSAAACRTYNVLASEGRKVVAAVLLSPSR